MKYVRAARIVSKFEFYSDEKLNENTNWVESAAHMSMSHTIL